MDLLIFKEEEIRMQRGSGDQCHSHSQAQTNQWARALCPSPDV